MVNVLFWFIVKLQSTNPNADSIKTIVTRYDVPLFNDRSRTQALHPCSMAAVITTTMTLRIILSVRGPLHDGGSFAGVWSSNTVAQSATRGIASARAPTNAPSVLQITSHTHTAPTYTIDGIGQKTEHGWDGTEGKTEVLSLPENDHKSYGSPMNDSEYEAGFAKAPGLPGVTITVDREVADFDPSRTK